MEGYGSALGGTVLLGSGMSFAKAVDSSGLSHMGQGIKFLYLWNLFFIILLATVVNFLTEIASNMAIIAMMLPILSHLS